VKAAFGALGGMASAGKDAKLFAGKPVCQPDSAPGRLAVILNQTDNESQLSRQPGSALI
jgi:hypothetical protein